ncbi:hypothetical protein ACLX1H_009779 [Fusarium chlamydosporum]
MWASVPPRTPLEVTFEDSDSSSDPGTAMPDYDSISPVVAHLEKLAVNHKDDHIDDCTASEYGASLESHTLVGDNSPPESPIEAFLLRPETPQQRYCPWNNEEKVTVRNGQTFTNSEIKLMSLAVAEARHNGELPATTETTLDVNAITDDFNSLVHLRRVRGDQLEHAPPSYVHLREQIALGIQQRAASQQRESQQEAARRVHHYLQAVEDEQRYYHATNAVVQHPAQKGFINVDDDMCSMVEHTIEQGIADATGPLRMNVGKLAVNVDQQTGLLQQQSHFIQYQNYSLQQQNDLALQQHSAVQRQTELAKQQARALQQQAGFLQRQDYALQQQYDLLQNQSYSLCKESRFFKKQNDALEKQNKAVREQLDLQYAHITRMQDLLEPQAFNNHATAQNLASANQLVSDLSHELPQVIKKAVKDTIEETSRLHARQAIQSAVDIWQQGVRSDMSLDETVSSSDRSVDTHGEPELDTPARATATKKLERKKKASADSEVIERTERSSLYRMVSKFKRRRIARN